MNIHQPSACTHTHTHLTALFPGLPGWAGTRKVKPIWILLKQETVSGRGISWAICKSASRSRQITMPVLHHSKFFTGRMPFLPPNQQRQSTEGTQERLMRLWLTYEYSSVVMLYTYRANEIMNIHQPSACTQTRLMSLWIYISCQPVQTRVMRLWIFISRHAVHRQG